jgi:hypothetical protein
MSHWAAGEWVQDGVLERDLHVHQRPVHSAMDGGERHRLSRAEALDHAPVLGLGQLRLDVELGHAEQLFFRVPELADRSLVDVRELQGVAVEDEHGVRRRIEEALDGTGPGFEGHPLGDVPDRRHDERVPPDHHRAQADLDRELRPVLAAPVQDEAGAHRPGPGLGAEALAVAHVGLSDPGGDEAFDRGADQLLRRVAEELLHPLVGEDERPVLVHHDQAVRCDVDEGRGEQPSEVPDTVLGRSGCDPAGALRTGAEWRRYGTQRGRLVAHGQPLAPAVPAPTERLGSAAIMWRVT